MAPKTKAPKAAPHATNKTLEVRMSQAIAKSEGRTEEVPEIISIGRVRSGKDWVVFKIRSKGDEVLSKEIIEAGSRNVTDQALKISVVREFMSADPGVSA